jgi:hypothetical protein
VTVDHHVAEPRTRLRPGARLVGDELESLVTLLGSKFPEVSDSDIRDLVFETYRRLASGASIQGHLIPLTLNRSRAALAADRATRGDL